MVDSPDRSFSDTDEEIMQATYRALSEHGYANLTIKRIAAEYGKSTAAIHYHYDTKDDLLAAFLDFLLDRFTDATRLNGVALLYIVQAALPLLNDGSSVFFLSSRGSDTVVPGYAAIGTAKAFGESLVRYLAKELAPKGIRANTVAAGPLAAVMLYWSPIP